MTYELKWRLVCVLFLILVVFWFVWSGDRKQRFVPANNISPKYASFPYLLWFPGYLLYFYILTCMEHRPHYEEAYPVLFSLCFVFFLHLTVYYGLLLLALPALRARLQARTCAVLWLLPCLLAVFVHPSSSEMFLSLSPVLTIPVSSALASTLGKIWSFGFFAVLIWKIAVHLQFCEKIESSSKKITDSEILMVWEQEQKATGEYPLLSSPILQSPLIHTPLSIGVFKMNTILVLPEKDYTAEELELIFRHEIIHIQRRDGATKFFLTFCAALCWFNPLLWKGIRRSAEDLELSCDEAVVANYSDKTRRHQYASLLLETAGDERGFTSCLAASTSALRYRLENIIAPRSRKSGAFLAALITFCMLMSVGVVSLSIQ